jgi:surface carbohydrate biosynthesis protein
MTIHVLMEVKARELEGRSLLAFRAALAGHQVFIGKAQQILDGVSAGILPSGVCVEKSISAAKEGRLKSRLEQGHRLVCQDEESGLLSDSYERFLDIRSSINTVAMTEAVFCWGEHDAKAWRIRYPHAAQKIYTTGSPRVDLWRPDFSPFFTSQVRTLKEQYGPYILVASNFALANGILSLEERVKRGWESGRITSASDERKLRSSFEDDVRMFQEFVKLLCELSKRSLGVKYIVRPHPAERIEPWQEALKGCDNVHVVFAGGISQWVRGCLAVLHNGCTTALESYVSGVPALAYVPFESERNRDIPNRLSIRRATVDDIANDVELLSKGGKLTSESPEANDLIRCRLANATGELAVTRIVRVLGETSDFSSPPFVFWKAQVFGLSLFIRSLWRRNVRRRFIKADHKFPGLQLRELVDIRDRLALCDSEYSRCKVRHVYGDVFLIEAMERRS